MSIAVAKALKQQITPEMLQTFECWKDKYGVSTGVDPCLPFPEGGS